MIQKKSILNHILISIIIYSCISQRKFNEKAPTLNRTLPIMLAVESSYAGNFISNAIKEELQKRKYIVETNENITQLAINSKKEQISNLLKSNEPGTFTDYQYQKKFGDIVANSNRSIAQFIKFELHFDIDTLTNKTIWNSASVIWQTLPRIVNKQELKEHYTIQQDELYSKDLDTIVFQLIDSLTIPRKK